MLAKDNNLQRALDALPADLRAVAWRKLERFIVESETQVIPESMIANLTRLCACSEFAGNTFLKEWRWLFEQQEALLVPPDSDELAAFATRIENSSEAVDDVKSEIRRFRNRYFLHVLWREYAALATLNESLVAISELADHLLRAAAGYAQRSLQERFGQVLDENGEPVSIVILGMGKLGGRELNFSSDIDLIFLYPDGSDSDGRKSLSPHEYFTRVSRVIVALIEEPTADGFAFRIDTRLRPFGDSGPPVTSFAALESYLVQHGRGWERYAYVKARAVGPPPPPAVEQDLYRDLISPFVYRRYLDYGVFESLREMRALIAAEVKRRDLVDNIKLGPGGIREIEFIVQSLQLVRGGSRPELQGRELQVILPKLTGRHGMDVADVDILQDAYEFLRRLENFIQAIHDQQTHDLPVDSVDQSRLAAAMQYTQWSELRADLDEHRRNVTDQFEKIAFREQSDDASDVARRRFAELWTSSATEAEWTEALSDDEFADAEAIASLCVAFKGTAAHADVAASQRLQQFIPNLLFLLRDVTESPLALRRVLEVAEQVLRRSAYLALLNENTHALGKLISLCSRSSYITRQITRYPVLLDELLDARIYTERLTREGLEEELKQRMSAADANDSEMQMELLGKFQRASQFRIALADFNGNLPIMRVSDSLTELAEVILEYALHIAWRDLTRIHGVPDSAGFGIIAYGKLGGLELSYGSDLDLVFLHDSSGAGQVTDGDKPLDHALFFTRLVRRLVHFLTTQTGSGMLYEIDTRLRPDGQSGLLVTSVEAFQRYQQENAWTWEHQALLRARHVAGSARIARAFERVRSATLRAGLHEETLRSDVISMRARMRKQLDKSDGEQFDLKQGKGGIGDIEFLVQYLVLANAAADDSVFHYSDNIRQLDALAENGCLDKDTALQLQDHYREFRLRAHHLLLDDNPALVGQDEMQEQRQFVAATWEKYLGREEHT
ncbi:MAG: bifunctional [glutamate--ammonia ligase]-adenylyl-L-tyrosine phosphorylase/[glutamate--ammonia-ligase] adenylyltransferase [Woeseiaceae bacterium]